MTNLKGFCDRASLVVDTQHNDIDRPQKNRMHEGLHKKKRYYFRRKENSTLEGANASALKECAQTVHESLEKYKRKTPLLELPTIGERKHIYKLG